MTRLEQIFQKMLRKVGKWTFFNFILSLLLIIVLISNATTLKNCLQEKRESLIQSTEEPQTTMRMVFDLKFFLIIFHFVRTCLVVCDHEKSFVK